MKLTEYISNGADSRPLTIRSLSAEECGHVAGSSIVKGNSAVKEAVKEQRSTCGDWGYFLGLIDESGVD